VVGNQLSRRVEASADTFALELTHDPAALIQVQRRLAIRNVANPDPPAIVTALVGTHPPTIDRIGAAIAYERGAR
jgi:STE24 endopeptidase